MRPATSTYNLRVDTSEIIELIDGEIESLQKAKTILTGATAKRGPRRPASTTPTVKKKRTLSPEARARIAAAQKKRWALAKKKG